MLHDKVSNWMDALMAEEKASGSTTKQVLYKVI